MFGTQAANGNGYATFPEANTLSGSVEWKPSGLLAEVTKSVESAIERATIVANRAEQIADAAFGPTPKQASGGVTNQLPAVAQSDMLRSTMSRLFAALDRLENEVSRLNAL